MAKKCIIVTSINPAGPALRKFSRIKGYDLVIVGDKKSPARYDLKAVYLDIKRQLSLYSEFARLIPYNHYARKNIGYLYAITNGYDIIGESDDDNIPLKGWGDIPVSGKIKTIISPKFPNVYKEFTNEHVWPRGLPLNLILSKSKNHLKSLSSNVLVWQGLANGSPDVDALFRLVINKTVKFEDKENICLSKGVVSPFNSQNTIWLKKAFCFLYLPHTVTFRYTDILRSFVAQYGIWARGGQLAFTSPTVIQKRNYHNFVKDFIDEYPMYVSFEKVIETLETTKLNGDDNDLLIMYKALLKAGIVKDDEIRSVGVWLNGLKN